MNECGVLSEAIRFEPIVTATWVVPIEPLAQSQCSLMLLWLELSMYLEVVLDVLQIRHIS